jgi:hypothetical protein
VFLKTGPSSSTGTIVTLVREESEAIEFPSEDIDASAGLFSCLDRTTGHIQNLAKTYTGDWHIADIWLGSAFFFTTDETPSIG